MESPAPIKLTQIWIADGCIVCNLCEETCPEVFLVEADTCVIRPTAERYFERQAARIEQAVAECPVDVIRVVPLNEPEQS